MWITPVLLSAAVVQAFAAQKQLLPAVFFPNTHPDSPVRFIAQTPELRRKDGVTFRALGVQFGMRFAGTSADVIVAGTDPFPATAAFLAGQDPKEWRRDTPMYRGVLGVCIQASTWRIKRRIAD